MKGKQLNRFRRGISFGLYNALHIVQWIVFVYHVLDGNLLRVKVRGSVAQCTSYTHARSNTLSMGYKVVIVCESVLAAVCTINRFQI